MKIHELAVQPRTETGSGAARRARKSGMTPAIIYSKGSEPKQVYLNAGEWTSISNQKARFVYLVDGSDKQIALVKEVQMNHLKAYCLHVDFQVINADEVINASVAVRPVGECAAEVIQKKEEIAVLCKPADLIEEVKVDVEKLTSGATILVKDIELPAGVTLDDDADAVVIQVN
ncbi:MAG: 50S ribosomal protein L25 [Lentisphaeria bacterium]|nr:50S ribosomal protein L25 [Lentisphaeria bacterium]